MTAPAISARELALVAMLATGHTTDRVARELSLSRYTVGEEISVLLGKFNCQNRAELVAYWYVHGLLPVGVWPPPKGQPRPGRARAGRAMGARGVRSGAFDSLAALRASGWPIDDASEAQRAVLAALTEEETSILVAVRRRLSAAAGESLARELWRPLAQGAVSR